MCVCAFFRFGKRRRSFHGAWMFSVHGASDGAESGGVLRIERFEREGRVDHGVLRGERAEESIVGRSLVSDREREGERLGGEKARSSCAKRPFSLSLSLSLSASVFCFASHTLSREGRRGHATGSLRPSIMADTFVFPSESSMVPRAVACAPRDRGQSSPPPHAVEYTYIVLLARSDRFE